MGGTHDFLGNSANMDMICQAKGEPGQSPVPTPTLEKKKIGILNTNCFQARLYSNFNKPTDLQQPNVRLWMNKLKKLTPYFCVPV